MSKYNFYDLRWLVKVHEDKHSRCLKYNNKKIQTHKGRLYVTNHREMLIYSERERKRERGRGAIHAFKI